MSILEGVLANLGMVVLERRDPNTYVLHSSQPIWFQELMANAGCKMSSAAEIDADTLYNSFPMIENFVIDAEAYWSGLIQPDQMSRSGVWSETNGNGAEYQLEARALRIHEQAILLIENLSDTFAQQHAIYQKARDIALTNEKLISELNYRQRKLQSEIESRLSVETSVQELSDSIENSPSAVLVCMPDGDIEVFNKALVDIYQMNDNENFVRSSMLDKWISEAETAYPEIHRVLKSGSYWEGEFKTSHMGQNEKWIRLSIGPIKNDEGDIEHFVCVANDLSDYKRVGNDWEKASEYDYNTHLPNRRQFWKHIESAFEANRGASEQVALLYIDIDYFKRINDEYGQTAGDFLLSSIASRISRNTKHRDFVAHLGGDEFVIMLRFVESADEVVAMAERLLGTISEPLSMDGHAISVKVSIGCAVDTIKDNNAKGLLRKADLAMYSAKELGKGQVRMYSDELEAHLPSRRQREHELIDALEQQQFVLEFQPQIPMRGSQDPSKLRLEALIRWQHPNLGLLGPDEFIAIAEDVGSIVPIGTWVLHEACKLCMQILDDNTDIALAVNISAKQLKHPKFYDILMESLAQSGFPADNLELEITESSFLEEMDQVITLLEKIRKQGISVALDDFGSGFSSLNYLKRLPVDYLKIDRSFVRDLPEDTESRAITTSVIQLAHQLQMRVVAEGVETEQQYEFLKEKGVDFYQGFYFYRPMSLEQILALKNGESQAK